MTVPNYQSMESVTLTTGAEVSGLRLDPDAGWALDLDELEAQLRPETRLVAVNFPNNPTGAVPDVATCARALRSVRGAWRAAVLRRGLSRAGGRGDPALAQAADLSERALSSRDVEGLRAARAARRLAGLPRPCAARAAGAAQALHDDLRPAPSELIATAALRRRDAITARNRAIIAANVTGFDAFFADWAQLFDWEPPRAGCVCFPRYLGADGVEAFCAALLREAGVVLLPASVFASALAPVPDDRFRIGVGRADPEPALAAFGAFLRARDGGPHARGG